MAPAGLSATSVPARYLAASTKQAWGEFPTSH
jgi:hypothetical protein